MKAIGKALLNLFFPRLCLLCKEPLVEGEGQICLNCTCSLPQTRYHRRLDNPAAKLFAGIRPLREVGAFLFFSRDEQVQKLIHTCKYYGNKELAYELGRWAAIEMCRKDGLYRSVDLLLPVPLHRKKQWKRGYNQSEWIAKGLASVLEKPICTTALRRTADTPSQTNKNIYDRHLNMERSFELKEAELLEGKHILLVDDVVTTGATLLACLDRLADIREIRLSVFALSIVKQL